MYEIVCVVIFLLVFNVLPLFVTSVNPKECIWISNDDFSECFMKLGKPIPRTDKIKCEELDSSQNKRLPPKKKKGPPPFKGGHGRPPQRTYGCKENKEVCEKTFRKLQINVDPFSRGFHDQIVRMFGDCCGSCTNSCMVSTIQDITQLNITLLSETDLIYPVFGATNKEKLYGYWYVPFVDIPYAYYVTKALKNEVIMRRMLEDFRALWPLLFICIMFSIAAGFLIWLLDTWGNREEFPREFLIGWFEGFWWSFISMTTVGYGDKAPKSRLARLFSIGWILIGITIFSMLTASLSNMMTNAESPPASDISGRKVGVLQYRIYDATVVAKHGGRVRVVPHDNITHGIDELIKLLEDEAIDGFLVDKHAYLFYCKEPERCRNLDETVRTNKHLDNDKYSYGVLMRNETDYNYFKRYMEYNWYYFDTCMDLALNEQNKNSKKKEERFVLFSVESGLFEPLIISVWVVIAVICLAGVVIEKISWKKKKNKTVSTAPKT